MIQRRHARLLDPPSLADVVEREEEQHVPTGPPSPCPVVLARSLPPSVVAAHRAPAAQRWPPRTRRIAPSASRCRRPSVAHATSHRRAVSVATATVDRTTGGWPPPLMHQAVMTVVALASRAMLTDVACRSPMSHTAHRCCSPLADVSPLAALASHANARRSGLTPWDAVVNVRSPPLTPHAISNVARNRNPDPWGLGCFYRRSGLGSLKVLRLNWMTTSSQGFRPTIGSRGF